MSWPIVKIIFRILRELSFEESKSRSIYREIRSAYTISGLREMFGLEANLEIIANFCNYSTVRSTIARGSEMLIFLISK
jgi:hypothetical protein